MPEFSEPFSAALTVSLKDEEEPRRNTHENLAVASNHDGTAIYVADIINPQIIVLGIEHEELRLCVQTMA